MTDGKKRDPAGRFDGLAGIYDRHRPNYPDTAIEFIVRRCGVEAQSYVVDIGCGTGISTRQMAVRGLTVVGIEPNAQMRAVAEATPVSPFVPPPTYRDGRAEATGLPNAVADLVLAAQAFHWFRPTEALSEFRRVLKPGGWVALMWNEQNRNDPFTAAFNQALTTHSPDPAIAARVQSSTGEHLLASPLFRHGERVEFPHVQEIDCDQLLGRAFSASYAPTATEQRLRLEEALRELHARYQDEGRVDLRYRTIVYLAQTTASS